MIINADDFGYSENVNEAVAEAFKRGLINRATIMVNMPCCTEAVALARKNCFMESVGLHINLTEGPALTEICKKSDLCDENGFFKGTFHTNIKSRFVIDKKLQQIMYAEIEAQIKRYIDLGFTLMHADSHNYVHTYPCVAIVYNKLLKKYKFNSVRISRNIPKGDFSSLFGMYKFIYNTYIKNLRTDRKKIETTKYFGSVADFCDFAASGKVRDLHNTELMTHPVMKDGELYDNTLPSPHPFIDNAWLNNYGICLRSFSKKKLLVTFIQTHIGGAMTSLVNFLNALKLDKYDVDVLFYENKDGGRCGIKDGINILTPAKTHKKYGIKNIASKLLYPPYVIAKLRELYNLKITHNRKKAVHIMAKQGCRYSRRLKDKYDIAVSYEFSWCMYYTAKYVKAKRKILWHHLDYEAAGFEFKMDKSTFDCYDNMIFVSDETMRKFVKSHPDYQSNSLYMPNLMASEYVQNKGMENVPLVFPNDNVVLKLITVARINFTHKGYDRGIEIMKRLKEEGLIDKIRWVIIGDGKDSEKLQKLITDNKLEDYVKWLGVKTNPIPYLKECDVLFMPSRFEGKPMAVTEAQMMGVVPLVSRYVSADEQIKSGYDGIVTDNNTDALYDGIKHIILKPSVIDELKKNIAGNDYGNTDKISIFDKLIDK